MSFFKASKKKEDLEQSTGSNFINSSGCYPVNIVAPFVSTSDNGSVSVDLFLDHKGQNQPLYGSLRIQNNNGSENKIGANIFNQLVVIADVEDIEEPTDGELPIGKKGAMKDVAVLEELCDIDVMVRVQLEYTAYNNNIQEKKIIKGFYRADDNASAEEIVNESEAGEQFKADSKYFENVVYKDGLDEEVVQAWIAAKRPKGTAPSGSSASSASKGKASFAKKGFGKNAS